MPQTANSPEAKLAALGITLPMPAAPVANYVSYVLIGNMLTISGQVCIGADGKFLPEHLGKLGASVSLEQGQAAAKQCGINILAQANAALGGLDKIKRCVRLGGFINSAPDFASLPLVMNGASDLMVAVLGDKGRHARSTVGVAQLPANCAVEVEALFEVE